MASKDHIIFQMITCNALMAKSSTSFMPPPPPLPNNFPFKKGDYEVNKLFEDGDAPEKTPFPPEKSVTDKRAADMISAADRPAAANPKAVADVKAATFKNCCLP